MPEPPASYLLTFRLKQTLRPLSRPGGKQLNLILFPLQRRFTAKTTGEY